MWSRLAKVLDDRKPNDRTQDEPSSTKSTAGSSHRRAESIVTSSSGRQPSLAARGDDRDRSERGYAPSSTSHARSSSGAYQSIVSPSVASSYATAASNTRDRRDRDYDRDYDGRRDRNGEASDRRDRGYEDTSVSRGLSRKNSEVGHGSGKDRSSKAKDPDRRDRSRSRERRHGDRDRSRSRDRGSGRKESDRDDRKRSKKEKSEKGEKRRRNSERLDQGTDRAGTEDGSFFSAQSTGNFNAQIGSQNFNQFPGQNAPSGVPGPAFAPPSGTPHFSSHVPDQFPGQFPDKYAAPYRPPVKAGLAAEYYGDQGESVLEQPGIRPKPPSIIAGTEPHLQTASAVPKPPVEPSTTGGVGAAAEFFSGADMTGGQNIPSGKQGKPGKPGKPGKTSGPAAVAGGAAAEFFSGAGMTSGQTSQSGSSNVPSGISDKPGKPGKTSGPAAVAGGAALGMAAGALAGAGTSSNGTSFYSAGSNVPSAVSPGYAPQPSPGSAGYSSVPPGNAYPPPDVAASPAYAAGYRPPGTSAPDGVHHSSSAPVVPTLGAAAAAAALGYLAGQGGSSASHQQQHASSSSYHAQSTTSTAPPQYVSTPGAPPGKQPKPGKQSSSHSNAGLYTAGAAALGAAALAQHHNHHNNTHHTSQHHSAGGSPYPSHGGNGAMAYQQRQRGPFGKIVDFWKDPEGVGKFEEYTEYIGVCRYCFDPNSSPRDAPRKHQYRSRRGSSERLSERYGSTVGIDKNNRYYSSDNNKKRHHKGRGNKSVLAAGLGTYGLAKLGKSLFKKSDDFDDNASVRTGRSTRSSWSFFRRNSSISPDRRSHTSYGVIHRSRSRSRDRKSHHSGHHRHSPHRSSHSGVAAGSLAAGALLAGASHSHKSKHRSRSRSKERTEIGIMRDGRVYKKETHGGLFPGTTRVTVDPNRRRRSKSRSRSRSRNRHGGLMGAVVGAAVGSAVAGPHSKRHGRSRSNSPKGEFIRPRRRSSGGRHSPRSHASTSYVDVSRTHRGSTGSLLGGFFSTPSERKRRVHKPKKRKGFFNFSNSSSSSSTDFDLAYGTGVIRRRESRTKLPKEKDRRVAEAAIVGAATLVAANELKNGRHDRHDKHDRRDKHDRHDKKGKERLEAVTLKDNTRRRPSSRRSSTSSSSSSDDDWESDVSDSSDDISGLTYGSFYDSKKAQRKSQDSLVSEASSGTGKWSWRWGSKKTKEKKRPDLENHGSSFAGPVAAGFAGAAIGAAVASSESKGREGSQISGPQDPLQRYHPVATVDPRTFDVTRQSSISSSQTQPVLISKPTDIDIRQPQPYVPVSQAVYATQGPPSSSIYATHGLPYQPPYTTPYGPPVFSGAPTQQPRSEYVQQQTTAVPPRQPTRPIDPFQYQVRDDSFVTRQDENRIPPNTRPRRRSSPTIVTVEPPASTRRRYSAREAPKVQFDASAKQAERQDREKRSDRQTREDDERRDQARRTSAQQAEISRDRARAEAEKLAQEEREARQREEDRVRAQMDRERFESEAKARARRDQEQELARQEQERIDREDIEREIRRKQREAEIDRQRVKRERELERVAREKATSDSWAAPVAAGAIAAAVGAFAAGSTASRVNESHEERPQRSQDRTRADREADIARKAAAKVVADRSQDDYSNVPSVLDKYKQKDEDIAYYVAPPELLDKSRNQQSPAPDADVHFDRHGWQSDYASPTYGQEDVQAYHVPEITMTGPKAPPYPPVYNFETHRDKVDPTRMSLPWTVPPLRLIAPTPPGSVCGGDFKGNVSAPGSPAVTPVDHPSAAPSGESSEVQAATSISKDASSEPKEPTIVSPLQEKKPKVKKSKKGPVQSPEESTRATPAPVVEEVKPGHVPGAFDDDLEFAATLAAGLQDTGFDPSIVLDDPTYHRRNSPPGSEKPGVYRKPFAETISDFSTYQPPTSTASVVIPAQGGFVEGEISEPEADTEIKSLPGQFVEEEAESQPKRKLSKKEQKTKNKEAKRQSVTGEGSSSDKKSAARQEASVTIFGGDVVDEPDSYVFEERKKGKSKRSKDTESMAGTTVVDGDIPSSIQRSVIPEKEPEVVLVEPRGTMPKRQSRDSGAGFRFAEIAAAAAATTAAVVAEDQPSRDKKSKRDTADSGFPDRDTVVEVPRDVKDTPAKLSKRHTEDFSTYRDGEPIIPVSTHAFDDLDLDDIKKHKSEKSKKTIHSSGSVSPLQADVGWEDMSNLEKTRGKTKDRKDPISQEREIVAAVALPEPADFDVGRGKSKTKSKRETQRHESPSRLVELSDIVKEARKDQKKSRGRISKRDSGVYESPSQSTVFSDVVQGALEDTKKSKSKKSKRDNEVYGSLSQSKGFSQIVDEDLEDTKKSRSNKSKRDNERYESPERSVVSEITAADYEKKSKRSKKDRDPYDQPESRSLPASEVGMEDPDERKSRRKSKRESKDYDRDTASVVSSTVSFEQYDGSKKSKGSKEKSGGLFNTLFGSSTRSVDVVPETRDDEETKKKSKKHKDRSSSGSIYDQGAAAQSTSTISSVSKVSSNGHTKEYDGRSSSSRKSKDKEERRKSRGEGSTVAESGRITHDQQDSKVYIPPFPGLSSEFPEVLLTRPEAPTLTDTRSLEKHDVERGDVTVEKIDSVFTAPISTEQSSQPKIPFLDEMSDLRDLPPLPDSTPSSPTSEPVLLRLSSPIPIPPPHTPFPSHDPSPPPSSPSESILPGSPPPTPVPLLEQSLDLETVPTLPIPRIPSPLLVSDASDTQRPPTLDPEDIHISSPETPPRGLVPLLEADGSSDLFDIDDLPPLPESRPSSPTLEPAQHLHTSTPTEGLPHPTPTPTEKEITPITPLPSVDDLPPLPASTPPSPTLEVLPTPSPVSQLKDIKSSSVEYGDTTLALSGSAVAPIPTEGEPEVTVPKSVGLEEPEDSGLVIGTQLKKKEKKGKKKEKASSIPTITAEEDESTIAQSATPETVEITEATLEAAEAEFPVILKKAKKDRKDRKAKKRGPAEAALETVGASPQSTEYRSVDPSSTDLPALAEDSNPVIPTQENLPSEDNEPSTDFAAPQVETSAKADTAEAAPEKSLEELTVIRLKKPKKEKKGRKIGSASAVVNAYEPPKESARGIPIEAESSETPVPMPEQTEEAQNVEPPVVKGDPTEPTTVQAEVPEQTRELQSATEEPQGKFAFPSGKKSKKGKKGKKRGISSTALNIHDSPPESARDISIEAEHSSTAALISQQTQDIRSVELPVAKDELAGLVALKPEISEQTQDPHPATDELQTELAPVPEKSEENKKDKKMELAPAVLDAFESPKESAQGNSVEVPEFPADKGEITEPATVKQEIPGQTREIQIAVTEPQDEFAPSSGEKLKKERKSKKQGLAADPIKNAEPSQPSPPDEVIDPLSVEKPSEAPTSLADKDQVAVSTTPEVTLLPEPEQPRDIEGPPGGAQDEFPVVSAKSKKGRKSKKKELAAAVLDTDETSGDLSQERPIKPTTTANKESPTTVQPQGQPVEPVEADKSYIEKGESAAPTDEITTPFEEPLVITELPLVLARKLKDEKTKSSEDKKRKGKSLAESSLDTPSPASSKAPSPDESVLKEGDHSRSITTIEPIAEPAKSEEEMSATQTEEPKITQIDEPNITAEEPQIATQAATLQTPDHIRMRSVGKEALSTSVPIPFMRLPASPNTAISPMALQGSTSSQTSPSPRRPRSSRPSSTEFRPLYLVERHKHHQAVEPEETYPSLPSSRTGSRSPSLYDAETGETAESSDAGSFHDAQEDITSPWQETDTDPMGGHAGLGTSTDRSLISPEQSSDILGSAQTTPRATSFPQDVHDSLTATELRDQARVPQPPTVAHRRRQSPQYYTFEDLKLESDRFLEGLPGLPLSRSTSTYSEPIQNPAEEPVPAVAPVSPVHEPARLVHGVQDLYPKQRAASSRASPAESNDVFWSRPATPDAQDARADTLEPESVRIERSATRDVSPSPALLPLPISATASSVGHDSQAEEGKHEMASPDLVPVYMNRSVSPLNIAPQKVEEEHERIVLAGPSLLQTLPGLPSSRPGSPYSQPAEAESLEHSRSFDVEHVKNIEPTAEELVMHQETALTPALLPLPTSRSASSVGPVLDREDTHDAVIPSPQPPPSDFPSLPLSRPGSSYTEEAKAIDAPNQRSLGIGSPKLAAAEPALQSTRSVSPPPKEEPVVEPSLTLSNTGPVSATETIPAPKESAGKKGKKSMGFFGGLVATAVGAFTGAKSDKVESPEPVASEPAPLELEPNVATSSTAQELLSEAQEELPTITQAARGKKGKKDKKQKKPAKTSLTEENYVPEDASGAPEQPKSLEASIYEDAREAEETYPPLPDSAPSSRPTSPLPTPREVEPDISLASIAEAATPRTQEDTPPAVQTGRSKKAKKDKKQKKSSRAFLVDDNASADVLDAPERPSNLEASIYEDAQEGGETYPPLPDSTPSSRPASPVPASREMGPNVSLSSTVEAPIVIAEAQEEPPSTAQAGRSKKGKKEKKRKKSSTAFLAEEEDSSTIPPTPTELESSAIATPPATEITCTPSVLKPSSTEAPREVDEAYPLETRGETLSAVQASRGKKGKKDKKQKKTTKALFAEEDDSSATTVTPAEPEISTIVAQDTPIASDQPDIPEAPTVKESREVAEVFTAPSKKSKKERKSKKSSRAFVLEDDDSSAAVSAPAEPERSTVRDIEIPEEPSKPDIPEPSSITLPPEIEEIYPPLPGSAPSTRPVSPLPEEPMRQNVEPDLNAQETVAETRNLGAEVLKEMPDAEEVFPIKPKKSKKEKKQKKSSKAFFAEDDDSSAVIPTPAELEANATAILDTPKAADKVKVSEASIVEPSREVSETAQPESQDQAQPVLQDARGKKVRKEKKQKKSSRTFSTEDESPAALSTPVEPEPGAVTTLETTKAPVEPDILKSSAVGAPQEFVETYPALPDSLPSSRPASPIPGEEPHSRDIQQDSSATQAVLEAPEEPASIESYTFAAKSKKTKKDKKQKKSATSSFDEDNATPAEPSTPAESTATLDTSDKPDIVEPLTAEEPREIVGTPSGTQTKRRKKDKKQKKAPKAFLAGEDESSPLVSTPAEPENSLESTQYSARPDILEPSTLEVPKEAEILYTTQPEITSAAAIHESPHNTPDTSISQGPREVAETYPALPDSVPSSRPESPDLPVPEEADLRSLDLSSDLPKTEQVTVPGTEAQEPEKEASADLTPEPVAQPKKSKKDKKRKKAGKSPFKGEEDSPAVASTPIERDISLATGAIAHEAYPDPKAFAPSSVEHSREVEPSVERAYPRPSEEQDSYFPSIVPTSTVAADAETAPPDVGPFLGFESRTKKSKKDKKQKRSSTAFAPDESESLLAPVTPAEPQPIESEENGQDASEFSLKRSKKGKKAKATGAFDTEILAASVAMEEPVQAESVVEDLGTPESFTEMGKNNRKGKETKAVFATEEESPVAPSAVAEQEPKEAEPKDVGAPEFSLKRGKKEKKGRKSSKAFAVEEEESSPAPTPAEQEPVAANVDNFASEFSLKRGKKDKKAKKAGRAFAVEEEESSLAPTPAEQEPAAAVVDDFASEFSLKQGKKDKKARKVSKALPAEEETSAAPSSLAELEPKIDIPHQQNEQSSAAQITVSETHIDDSTVRELNVPELLLKREENKEQQKSIAAVPANEEQSTPAPFPLPEPVLDGGIARDVDVPEFSPTQYKDKTFGKAFTPTQEETPLASPTPAEPEPGIKSVDDLGTESSMKRSKKDKKQRKAGEAIIVEEGENFAGPSSLAQLEPPTEELAERETPRHQIIHPEPQIDHTTTKKLSSHELSGSIPTVEEQIQRFQLTPAKPEQYPEHAGSREAFEVTNPVSTPPTTQIRDSGLGEGAIYLGESRGIDSPRESYNPLSVSNDNIAASSIHTTESSSDPLNISVELDPSYEISVSRPRGDQSEDDSAASVEIVWHPQDSSSENVPQTERAILSSPGLQPSKSPETIAEPSPVESTTKERDSILFKSPPAKDPSWSSPSPRSTPQSSERLRSREFNSPPKEDTGELEFQKRARRLVRPDPNLSPSPRPRQIDVTGSSTVDAHISGPLSSPPAQPAVPSLFGGHPRTKIDTRDVITPTKPPYVDITASEKRRLNTITEDSPEGSPHGKRGLVSTLESHSRPVKGELPSISPDLPTEQGLDQPHGTTSRNLSPSSELQISKRDPKLISTEDLIARLSWPAVDEEEHTVDIDRVKKKTPSRFSSISPIVAEQVANRDATLRSPSGQSARSSTSLKRLRTADRDPQHRPTSSLSNRSLGLVESPQPRRPTSVLSGRSNGQVEAPLSPPRTPPLRRVDRSVSSDLRAASKRDQLRQLANPPPDLSLPSSSTHDQGDEKGKGHLRDMPSVYEGWGDVQGSPMSPTRPQSIMRRRHSMQLMDLENKLDQLISENRLLAEAKTKAEEGLEDALYNQNRNSSALNEALETRALQLREKDTEINQLRETLEQVQKEVAKLSEVNEGISALNASLSQQNQSYQNLRAENAHKDRELEETTRQLEDLRHQHGELSSGMETIVRREISVALEEKNTEIRRLRNELSSAKEQIKALQKQILESKPSENFLIMRDEDYFEIACQTLCQHVQEWVLRFSKFSDGKACRLVDDIEDQKIRDRVENSILDDTDVDEYLSDRVKRRDVFMSVVMTMVWEYIFTRYLFGMDREQRQKLKSLEKILAEVGPVTAVHQWRATTLTLLSRREAFLHQRAQDTEAVVQEIYHSLSYLLPPPSHLEERIQESLRNVMRLAVDLSIEMRTQRAEYMMLPPLQPEFDTNGDLVRKVYFNALIMNERSGNTVSNEDLQGQQAVVRIVLFPLVVKKGDQTGAGEEEIVVCPAQVLVAKPAKEKKVVRVLSGDRMSIDAQPQPTNSAQSMRSTIDMGNMI